jgi:hypothetical protein
MQRFDAPIVDEIPEGAVWRKVIARYNKPDARASILNLAVSIIPYALLWYLMYRFLSVSIWITLALSLPHGRGKIGPARRERPGSTWAAISSSPSTRSP